MRFDEQAPRGVRRLADAGLRVGACSGAAVAAAQELLVGPDAEAYRARLGVGDATSVLLFATDGVTDGVTDPAALAM
jgi:cysteine synthase